MNLNITKEEDCNASFYKLGTVSQLGLTGKITGALDSDIVGACVCTKGKVLNASNECMNSADDLDLTFPNTYKIGASCGTGYTAVDISSVKFLTDKVRTALEGVGFSKFCKKATCPTGYTLDTTTKECVQTLPDGSKRTEFFGFMLNPSLWWFGVGNVTLVLLCICCLCSISSWAAMKM